MVALKKNVYTAIVPVFNPGKSESVLQNPTQKKYQQVWGAYTGNTVDSFISFQKQVGRQAQINAIFLDWGKSFPASSANPIKNADQTLVIFWEPNNVSLDKIVSGQYDVYAKEFAMQISNYKKPVILVPFEEMNGNWDAWDGTVGNNTPAKVVLAFQHVHDLFSGVKNVKWGWAVNNDSVPDTTANAIKNYYPGDRYVDYVGVDGFNFGNPWQAYSEIFSSALQQLKTYNKPIYIFSMACAEGPQKSAWIQDTLTKIKADPSIAGWIWFNENKEQNWLVSSDTASLQAFQSGI